MFSIERMVKSAAQANGLSVNRFAFRAEMDPNQLRQCMRRDSVNTKTLMRLAEALSISVSDLVKYGEE